MAVKNKLNYKKQIKKKWECSIIGRKINDNAKREIKKNKSVIKKKVYSKVEIEKFQFGKLNEIDKDLNRKESGAKIAELKCNKRKNKLDWLKID